MPPRKGKLLGMVSIWMWQDKSDVVVVKRISSLSKLFAPDLSHIHYWTIKRRWDNEREDCNGIKRIDKDTDVDGRMIDYELWE